jgi:hypothetical protein
VAVGIDFGNAVAVAVGDAVGVAIGIVWDVAEVAVGDAVGWLLVFTKLNFTWYRHHVKLIIHHMSDV